MEQKLTTGFKVLLQANELERYRKYLERNGGKMATHTRQLILRALEDDEAVKSGRTQIDMGMLRKGAEA